MRVKIFIKSKFMDQEVCAAKDVDKVIDRLFEKYEDEEGVVAHVELLMPYVDTKHMIPTPQEWVLYDKFRIEDIKRYVR